uniref:NADH-ubiquinone oxidoreductase chain 2 n=1 Tax=Aphaenogaster famelica TaxID=255788 RepID=A0A6B9BQE8_9HYME|nr:NADH dehydrogenase subunit 2 [Aphaenogaster famelica]QGW36315.1 NADH dehydrogenase subunit 2 [Aphaenogaster famelica]
MFYILFFKYFVTLNLILFSFISLFTSDLMTLWFFLEINNFLFISMAQIQTKKKKMIFMYFIIQVIASFIMIFTIIMNNFFFFNNYLSLLFFLSLLFKLGIPPFHSWLPLIAPFLSWNILLIMLTIQKLIPFYMLSLMKMNTFTFYIVLIMCCIIPPYMSLNKNNFKLIMAYSSINQASWMILLIYMKILLWLNYFIFYTMISFSLFWFINYYKMIMNFKYMSINNSKLNIIPFMLLLNMAGMPPFSFFIMKWYSIYFTLYNSNFFLILIMMMMSSLFMLYIYINMTLYNMFIYKYMSKLIFTTTNMPKYFMILMFFSLFSSQILLII